MRISELAEESGHTISTLKYYLRVGILMPGESTGRNQARYDESHLRRLALIDVLQDELDMSIETIRELLCGRVPAKTKPQHSTSLSDERELLGLGRDFGWLLEPDDPAVEAAIAAVGTIQRVTPRARPRDYLPRFAEAMVELARQEIPDQGDTESDRTSDSSLLETVLYEPLLLALRRIARAQRRAQVSEMAAVDARKKKAPSVS